jgi:transposase
MTRVRRKHSKEFKAEIIRLVRGGKSASEVARAHDLAVSLVAGWVAQAKVDDGEVKGGALTTLEKQELSQLRKEIRELRMERDFLKKCSAWFARQST